MPKTVFLHQRVIAVHHAGNYSVSLTNDRACTFSIVNDRFAGSPPALVPGPQSPLSVRCRMTDGTAST